jgi:hypothetical protein
MVLGNAIDTRWDKKQFLKAVVARGITWGMCWFRFFVMSDNPLTFPQVKVSGSRSDGM